MATSKPIKNLPAPEAPKRDNLAAAEPNEASKGEAHFQTEQRVRKCTGLCNFLILYIGATSHPFDPMSATWAQFGVNFGQQGRNLGPTLMHLAPTWSNLALGWTRLRAISTQVELHMGSP